MKNEEKIALFIDCDNISSKYINVILSELSKYGPVTYRRMYGDWAKPNLKQWLGLYSKYSLTPIMQVNDTPGKNATDIALIIDAMDILYSNQVEGFCIVSSDGDFNRLAKRIRESGKRVIGMGEQKTPEAFRVSCEKFIYLDILQEEEEGQSNSIKLETDEDKNCNSDITSREDIVQAVVNMIFDSSDNEMVLADVGQRLVKIFPDFDVRNYNYNKLSTFLKEFNELSVYNKQNNAYVSIQSEPLQKLKNSIVEILTNNNNRLNIGELKRQLILLNPNFNITIRNSGVTKFSTFLEKNIDIVRIENNTAILKNTIK